MSTLTETKQTPHDKLKNQIANDYRAKGYTVTTEKRIGNRRVDIFAQKDKETLIIEVVDSHYSGPLDDKFKIVKPREGKFKVKTNRVGKSLRITLPVEIADYLHLEEGDIAELWEEGGKIIIAKKEA